MATPYISMAGIGKSFGPVHALKSVNLTVYPGEIHALLGENGAGKSTLMKVLSGIHEPTKGTITINNISYNKLKFYPEYMSRPKAPLPLITLAITS